MSDEKVNNFKHSDVIKVAEAVVTHGVAREYQGDYGNHEYLYECMFCDASEPEENKIKHDSDCPVLIAQDLLTGS